MRSLFNLLFLYHKIALIALAAVLSLIFLATGHSLNVSDKEQMYFFGHIAVFVVSSMMLFAVGRDKPRHCYCLLSCLLFSLSQLLLDALKVVATSGNLVKSTVLSLVLGIINDIFIPSIFIFKPTIVFPENQRDVLD